MSHIVENPIYGFVKVLNNEGLQILEIDGEYFSVSEFLPADKNTPYAVPRRLHVQINGKLVDYE